MLKLVPPASGRQTDEGKGARISSTAYVQYGRFSARFKAAGPVGGMVTSFISMSDEKDEIDWEVVGGKDNDQAQTNYFIKGLVDYTNSEKAQLPSLASQQTYEYVVDWNAQRIEWVLNGRVVRTVPATSPNFPNTPSRIQFAVWDGGFGQEGTRNWAGGYIDWTAAGTARNFNATFESVSIQWYFFIIIITTDF